MSTRADEAATPTTGEIAIPELSLVMLIGASGSGKSTFGREHFGRFEVVSSDFCRGLVADDENDQDASADAFDLLHHLVGLRLAAGRLTVVDATNVQAESRRALLEIAKAHDVLPIAIVLDVAEAVCVARNADRADRTFAARVITRQRDQLRRSLRGLKREGFRGVHVLRTEAEVGGATVVRHKLLNDYRDQHQPFDAIGDVHGCRAELEELLDRLGYAIVRDDADRPVDAVHPKGRRVLFLGDLVDRGPDSPGVLRLAMGMTAAGHAFAVPGNHEHKLVRAMDGRAVQVTHGLAETLEQLAAEPDEFRSAVHAWCRDLVSHLVLDDGRLVIAHAGLKEAYHGRASGRVRSFALYGDTTGETDDYGLPVRYPWAQDYRGRAMVLYGHTPTPELQWVNNTLCLDTGCVFGGHLSALRYPERETVQVAAHQVWYEPARPFPAAHAGGAEPASAERAPDELSLTDVVGRRSVQTEHHGRVAVREENAAGALEVMSRFALPARWLPYLPPTMAPVPTAPDGPLLERPVEAFAAYAADGVTDVICQEKHMGSRAVALICRSEAVARDRFDAAAGESGAVWTRTGRSFFAAELTRQLLDRARSAVESAGLFDELGSDWILLDCELLPWSAKAAQLLRDQYAAVGAAARAVFPPALAGLDAAAERGVDVAALRNRTARRQDNASAYVRAYRRYCWATTDLDGIQVAPFQVLATEGATWEAREHGWHLAAADRLVGVDPTLFRRTARLGVRTTDAESVAAGDAWWTALTAAGGEGMVVKPLANLTRGRRGLVQPGLKVRGAEYLRIIYGPDYPDHLDRLRARNLGHKRSLALREYALGLESLRRLVERQPLWRVHEAVFAVLALESEPVDPRL